MRIYFHFRLFFDSEIFQFQPKSIILPIAGMEIERFFKFKAIKIMEISFYLENKLCQFSQESSFLLPVNAHILNLG